MKKVYIITEDSYYWNMLSGYSSNSSQVIFVFSSKQKALAQLDKINELNEDSCWWSEACYDALLCRETSDRNVIRQDCYSHVFEKAGEQYRWSHYISIVEKVLNQGYAL